MTWTTRPWFWVEIWIGRAIPKRDLTETLPANRWWGSRVMALCIWTGRSRFSILNISKLPLSIEAIGPASSALSFQ